MKNRLSIWLSGIAIVVISAIGIGCGTHNSHEHGSGTASNGASDAIRQAEAINNDYVLKYEWPEKPRIGSRALKVTLTDKAGTPVEGAEVAVSYDMPSMRGAHDTTENMKQNANGDYLLPIHFVMPGDWEIVISAMKDGVEIASELILLDI